MPTSDLRRLVAETERAVGPTAPSAVVLRRELLRREWPDLAIYRDRARRRGRSSHSTDTRPACQEVSDAAPPR